MEQKPFNTRNLRASQSARRYQAVHAHSAKGCTFSCTALRRTSYHLCGGCLNVYFMRFSRPSNSRTHQGSEWQLRTQGTPSPAGSGTSS